MHERIQKWLQVLTFGVLMLFVGSQFEHQAKMHKSPAVTSDWYVENSQDMERYLTNGQMINGHYFGAINLKNNCDKDIMLLSLSSYDDQIHQYEGEMVRLKVTINGYSEVVTLPVLAIQESGFGPHIMLMSNFVMNTTLKNDLSKATEMQVEVLQPEAMADLLTVQKEVFSLRGFQHARQQSQLNCRLI